MKFLQLLLFLIFISNFVLTEQSSAQTEVDITSGSNEQIREEIRKTIERTLEGINIWIETDEWVFEETSGYETLKEIVISNKLKSTREHIETIVIRLSNDNLYEVPGLYVQSEDGSPYEYDELIIVLNSQQEVIDARLANPEHNYNHILNRSIEVLPEEKEKVLAYIAEYSGAFSNQSREFIKNAFVDNATIVRGTIYDGVTYLYRETTESYTAWITEHVFQNQDNLTLQFHDIEVYRHPNWANIYGVLLYQEWNATNYSDSGYLYLTLDFGEDDPKILVRVWQENEFERGKFSGVEALPPKEIQMITEGLGKDIEPESADYINNRGGVNRGYIKFNIYSDDEDLLNVERLKNWIDEGILWAEGIDFENSEIVILDENTLWVPFIAKQLGQEQHKNVTIEIFETSLLESNKIDVKLYMQNTTLIGVIVKEKDEISTSNTIPDIYGNKYFHTNVDNFQYEIWWGDYGRIFSSRSESFDFSVRLLQGNYTLNIKKEGFLPKEIAFTSIAGVRQDRSIELQEIFKQENLVSSQSRFRSLINSKRFWLIAGGSLIASSVSLLLIMNTGDSISSTDPITFPSPPGRP